MTAIALCWLVFALAYGVICLASTVTYERKRRHMIAESNRDK